jgi:menaquinone-specific isochorismate synthase
VTDLVAHTRRLDGPVDLLAVAGRTGLLFEQAGHGLAGRGIAARVELPTGPGRLLAAATVVSDALAAIEADDELRRPGTGPVAFAALPFADATPATVTVPSVVVGRSDDGVSWVTTIGTVDNPIHDIQRGDLEAPPTPWPAPSSYTVRPVRPPEEWCAAVAEAVSLLRAGALHKVVLSREVLVEADLPFDVLGVLGRLRASYPSGMLYSIDGFVGATPELLVSRFGDVVRSHPHAGTIPRSGDPEVDARRAAALLASPKDRAEHQVAIDMVLDTLLAFTSYVDSEPEPSIVTLANVQHLASLVEGRLSSPPADVLTLVAALHPTPAICGFPTESARALIAQLEGYDRGRYSGNVGWVDAAGDGRFAIALRCAEIDGHRARLFAGNGIVADSDPETELTETRAKLQAMLGALIRP